MKTMKTMKTEIRNMNVFMITEPVNVYLELWQNRKVKGLINEIDDLYSYDCIFIKNEKHPERLQATILLIEEVLMREFYAKNAGKIPESEIDDAAAKYIISCDVRAEICETGVKYFCEYETL